MPMNRRRTSRKATGSATNHGSAMLRNTAKLFWLPNSEPTPIRPPRFSTPARNVGRCRPVSTSATATRQATANAASSAHSSSCARRRSRQIRAIPIARPDIIARKLVQRRAASMSSDQRIDSADHSDPHAEQGRGPRQRGGERQRGRP